MNGQAPPLVSQILSIIRRRKWVIIGATLGAILLGLVVTLLMTPKYTASSTVEIQREVGSFVKVEGAEQQDTMLDQEFYETQYGLLRSEALAQRVGQKTKLFDNPEFLKTIKTSSRWVVNGEMRTDDATRSERIEATGKQLLLNLSIQPQRLSRLVKIYYTSTDPELARRIANEWSATFIQLTLERKFEATAYARNFLESRLVQLRGRIDQSERALVDYASRAQIVNLPGSAPANPDGTPAPERSLVADNLVTLNDELGKATADRVRAESRLSSSASSVTEALENPAIGTLRQSRAELAASYARLMTQFKPDYPPAQAVKSQLDQLDRALGREEGRVQTALRETYSASRKREQDLSRQVEGLKGDLLNLRRRTIQYDIFKRDVDTNQQLYDALLQRYKEIGVAGGVGVNNISVVDPAQTPRKPATPNLLLNLALATLAGLVLGAGAAVLLEQLDQGITDPGSIEPLLGVPLLGTVPKVVDATTIESLADRKSSISEAYLSLQANLGFTTAHGLPKSMAVTSTGPSEGKSTTSYALAHSLARTNRRVLLVDGDMRSPSVHQMFGIANGKGLSNYLSGDDDLVGIVQPVPGSALSVVTAGPTPPSAAELLSGDRLVHMLNRALETFDHIIIDSPPVMGLADAPLIGGSVEAVVFVLESHRTQKGMARVAVSRMLAGEANMVGAILTKFDVQRAHYGYGYDYGYGYGYGTTDKKTG